MPFGRLTESVTSLTASCSETELRTCRARHPFCETWASHRWHVRLEQSHSHRLGAVRILSGRESQWQETRMQPVHEPWSKSLNTALLSGGVLSGLRRSPQQPLVSAEVGRGGTCLGAQDPLLLTPEHPGRAGKPAHSSGVHRMARPAGGQSFRLAVPRGARPQI